MTPDETGRAGDWQHRPTAESLAELLAWTPRQHRAEACRLLAHWPKGAGTGTIHDSMCLEALVHATLALGSS